MTPRIIDPFGPMNFGAGQMVTVHRTKRDAYGDPLPGEGQHEIGPCAIAVTEQQMNTDGEGPRARTVYVVSAPTDSDIRESDRVTMPDGTPAVVTKAPKRPRNPFTGWQPFVRFEAAGD